MKQAWTPLRPVARDCASRDAHSNTTYRADIDGLRALAVSSVLIFHAAPSLLPGGFAGVDVFFVISGYLISGIIFRELGQRCFSISNFYSRRIRRIFPALAAVLLASWMLGWTFSLSPEFRALGEAMALGATFAANLGVYLDREWYFSLGVSDPLLHLWSLGVEEQFYIAWPALMVLAWKTQRWCAPIIALLTGGCFLLNAWAATSNPLADYYLPWNRLWELSAGALLAYAAQQPHSISLPHSFTPNLQGVAGFIILFGSFVLLDGSGGTAFPGWWGLLPVVGTLLVISAGHGQWVGRRILSTKPVVYIGLISYPLYLWHLPLLSFIRRLDWTKRMGPWVAVTLTIALAILTYRYIEAPIRRSAARQIVVPALLVLMAMCATLGATTYFGLIDSRSQSYSLERYVLATTEDWLPTTEHGQSGRANHWTLGLDEFLQLGRTSPRALFIGDSLMQQYYQRVEKLVTDSPQGPRGALFAVRAGCVPGGVEMLHFLLPSSYVRDCRKLIDRAFRHAGEDSIDTIVIGGAWDWYFSAEPDSGRPWRTGSERGLQSLRDVISNLVRNHKRVFLILAQPGGVDFDPRSMIQRNILEPAFEVHAREFVPRAAVGSGQEQIAATIRKLAQESGATVIDPSDELCRDQMCRALTSEGEPIYHDGGHLRPSYVRDNATFLDQILR